MKASSDYTLGQQKIKVKGKIYTSQHAWTTKTDADLIAEKIREHGKYKAVVRKEGDKYIVYVRKIE